MSAAMPMGTTTGLKVTTPSDREILMTRLFKRPERIVHNEIFDEDRTGGERDARGRERARPDWSMADEFTLLPGPNWTAWRIS